MEELGPPNTLVSPKLIYLDLSQLWAGVLRSRGHALSRRRRDLGSTRRGRAPRWGGAQARAGGVASPKAAPPGHAPSLKGPPIGPPLVRHPHLPPPIPQARVRGAYVGLESEAGGVAFGALKEEGSKISTTVEAAWALGRVAAASRRRPRAHQGVRALRRRPGRVDAASSLFPA